MRRCYIITIEDGADFQRLMRKRVFLNEDLGRKWGQDEEARCRGQRRHEGETDQVYVNAIEYHVTIADLDDSQ